jgi:hypothetical protein
VHCEFLIKGTWLGYDIFVAMDIQILFHSTKAPSGPRKPRGAGGHELGASKRTGY